MATDAATRAAEAVADALMAPPYYGDVERDQIVQAAIAAIASLEADLASARELLVELEESIRTKTEPWMAYPCCRGDDPSNTNGNTGHHYDCKLAAALAAAGREA
jgi:hypothetical protein